MLAVLIEKIADFPCKIPLFCRRVPAGFPSPADDYVDEPLDLRAYLIARPASTFMLTVDGPSMEGAGIMSGDKIAVDRSVTPKPGHIVVGIVHGEMTVKRLKRAGQGYVLAPEPRPDSQEHFPTFRIDEGTPFEIWGVVVGVVRRIGEP